MSQYFLNRNGQQLGPWTQWEILKKIEESQLAWSDYIFDERKNDWVFLFEFEVLAKKNPSFQEPGIRTPENSQPEKTEYCDNKGDEWFVLKGDQNRYGPFCFQELVEMLEKKSLLEFDYIWTSKLEGWQRVSESNEFTPEKIREIKGAVSPEAAQRHYRRRHARAKYGASILIHDNSSVWKGRSLELSPTGAGLLIDSDEIQLGQVLFLHFKAGDGVPPFNAICSIVSKQAGEGRVFRYGVKFTSISRSIQVAIKKYTDRAA